MPLSRNLGTLTSWNSLDHSRPVTGLLLLSNYVPFIGKLLIYITDSSFSTSRLLFCCHLLILLLTTIKDLLNPNTNNQSLTLYCCILYTRTAQPVARGPYATRNTLLYYPWRYYIYNFFFLWRCGPTSAMVSSFMRFLDHTQRRTTVGRTPLDE